MASSKLRSTTTKENINDMSQPELAEHFPNLCPTMADHGYMELLWENGQIVVQRISKNRTDKASIPSTSIEAPEEVDHVPTTLPADRTKMNNQEHEMNPMLDYPFDDIYRELFPEVSGLDLDCLSLTVPADESTNYSQMEGDTHAAENPSTSKDLENQEFLFRQQCQPFMSSSRSKHSDMVVGAFDHCGGNGDLPIKILQDQELTSSKHPSSSAPLMNFSHFSRVAAQVDSNFQFMDMRSNSVTACTPVKGGSMEPNSVRSANHEMRKVSAFRGQMPTVRFPGQHAKMAVSFQNSEPICWENDARNTSKHNGNTCSAANLRLPDNVSCHGSSFQGHSVARKKQREKRNEPVNILPSVCSANVGAGASPNDIKRKAKWKIQEGEASEYRSEGCEDDSAGTSKPTTRKNTSIKRSRGVGLHSLTERRRRDRINEKIRALRRLIPNCTMVDKASTLNEAIEYLKTLQMQVQIMLMYSGLHMMPVMLSSGTPPPICPSHPSPLAPMGFNMGMSSRLGFGMGMLEMTGPSMVPLMPHMQGPLSSYGSIPQTGLLQYGMPASSSLHMFGEGSSPISIPHPASMTPLSAVPMKENHTSSAVPMKENRTPEVVPEQAVDSDLPNPKDEQLQTTDAPGGETSSKIGHKSWH